MRGGGGRGGRAGAHGAQPSLDKPKREAILDLQKYMNERIRVKFTGGREGASRFYVCLWWTCVQCYYLCKIVTGILKGHDQLLNLVLDDVEEIIHGISYLLSANPSSISNAHADAEPRTRSLGLVVLRGPTITLLNPVDGMAEIENPFAEQQQ